MKKHEKVEKNNRLIIHTFKEDKKVFRVINNHMKLKVKSQSEKNKKKCLTHETKYDTMLV